MRKQVDARADVIRRRFKHGTSIASLNRTFGSRRVAAAIREGLNNERELTLEEEMEYFPLTGFGDDIPGR